MSYVINKDVPLPQGRGPSNSKYPFNRMEIGESILVEPMQTAISARVAASVLAKRKGRKFVSRREGDGLRIWRAA